MAEVYKAKLFSNHGFEMLLVLKKILQHHSANEEFVQMFVDEAKITVELRHQNIVQIYDFGCYNENYFIAMECVDGKDLKTLLKTLAKRGEFIPIELVVYIAHEMCKGLDYAHKKIDASGKELGVVHRDITPANILISYTGEVKIADFGIAKARTSVYNTKDGVLKGKYEYMSPEQASGEAVDFRSDIFEVGILLHEMLTGRRLFRTESDLETLELIKSGIYSEPIERHPRVTPRLNQMTMRALQRNKATRFADAKTMQSALAECISPNTPSALADQLSSFMQETFKENIELERKRTKAGTEGALKLWHMEDDMELEELSLIDERTSSRRQSLIIILCIILSGVTGYLYSQHEEKQLQTEEIYVIQPRSLQIEVFPKEAEAMIMIDERVMGEHDLQIEEDDLKSSIEVRVVAEGYESWEKILSVKPGESSLLRINLTPAPTNLPDFNFASPEESLDGASPILE